jgi:hypothetical protein
MPNNHQHTTTRTATPQATGEIQPHQQLEKQPSTGQKQMLRESSSAVHVKA